MKTSKKCLPAWVESSNMSKKKTASSAGSWTLPKVSSFKASNLDSLGGSTLMMALLLLGSIAMVSHSENGGGTQALVISNCPRAFITAWTACKNAKLILTCLTKNQGYRIDKSKTWWNKLFLNRSGSLISNHLLTTNSSRTMFLNWHLNKKTIWQMGTTGWNFPKSMTTKKVGKLEI